ncbi:hypothetical protein NFJ02_17g27650 [Pycnococcus provasolii]
MVYKVESALEEQEDADADEELEELEELAEFGDFEDEDADDDLESLEDDDADDDDDDDDEEEDEEDDDEDDDDEDDDDDDDGFGDVTLGVFGGVDGRLLAERRLHAVCQRHPAFRCTHIEPRALDKFGIAAVVCPPTTSADAAGSKPTTASPRMVIPTELMIIDSAPYMANDPDISKCLAHIEQTNNQELRTILWTMLHFRRAYTPDPKDARESKRRKIDESAPEEEPNERYVGSLIHKVHQAMFRSLPRIKCQYTDDDGGGFGTLLTANCNTLTMLEECDDPTLYDLVIKQRDATKEMYDLAFPKLMETYPNLFPEEVGAHYEHFVHACELWMSRAMTVKFPGEDETKNALVPCAWWLNHKSPPEAHVVNYSCILQEDGTDCMVLQVDPARRDAVAGGEQLFLSYGRMTNRDLMLGHAMCILKNPCDAHEVMVNLNVTNSEWLEDKGITVHPYVDEDQNALESDWYDTEIDRRPEEDKWAPDTGMKDATHSASLVLTIIPREDGEWCLDARSKRLIRTCMCTRLGTAEDEARVTQWYAARQRESESSGEAVANDGDELVLSTDVEKMCEMHATAWAKDACMGAGSAREQACALDECDDWDDPDAGADEDASAQERSVIQFMACRHNAMGNWQKHAWA